ncbi:MAG: putative signal transducing protein [Planctomycetota bacterium]|jgi:hypothetical protein
MNKVYSARDSMEAHFVRCLLEREGIEAVVFGETLSLARGELPLTTDTLPSVWVKPEDVERAMTIVDRYEAGYFEDEGDESFQPPPPWICPSCGEEVEGHFTACWNCQTSKPGD